MVYRLVTFALLGYLGSRLLYSGLLHGKEKESEPPLPKPKRITNRKYVEELYAAKDRETNPKEASPRA